MCGVCGVCAVCVRCVCGACGVVVDVFESESESGEWQLERGWLLLPYQLDVCVEQRCLLSECSGVVLCCPVCDKEDTTHMHVSYVYRGRYIDKRYIDKRYIEVYRGI